MVLNIIPVQGTFDIARGRQMLRTHTSAQHWPPNQIARVCALLTAIGELIVRAELSYTIPIEVLLGFDHGQRKILMHCSVIFEHISAETLFSLEKSIQRAADQVDITQQLNRVGITAHLYFDSGKEKSS